MALVEVTFPGDKKVAANIHGHSIVTDQSKKNGGEGAAPEPFELFLASIGTCAGIYAKSFCDERNLPSPRGLDLDLSRADGGLISKLELVLHVDSDFPSKYDRAIIRSMELCAVKKQLRTEIETTVRVARKNGTESAP